MPGSKRSTVYLVFAASVFSCKPRSDLSSRQLDDDARGQHSGEGSYTGHADYRLAIINHSGPNFDPNQDVLKPSAKDELREKVGEALWGAAVKALVPLSGAVSGQWTGTEPDLIDGLGMFVENARRSIKEDLRPILAGSRDHFPMVSEAMVIPWLNQEEDNLFYDADKISMSAVSVTNTLGSSAGSPKFQQRLTESIQEMRKKQMRSALQPTFLLAARQFLFVSPENTRLTIRVLLGLKPLDQPFDKEDPRLKFSKIVVPSVADRGSTVSLTFDIDLADDPEEPKLLMEFGDFEKYEAGLFKMAESGTARVAPRLEGQANKTGTSWIALNFTFKKLTMNLRSAMIADLDTLLSPGVRFGTSNFVVGGFAVDSVDEGFQNEINRTIDDSIRGALEAQNEAILGGMMTQETMDQVFQTIFRREVAR